MIRTILRLTAVITLVGLAAGCAPGLISGRPSDPNLERVLISDSGVPAKQGLLFMAMQDAEVAVQSAGFALTAEEPEEAKGHIDNVLYAIDPSYPPTPTVTSSGIASFWPGIGYGLRRSVSGIADQMHAVESRHASRAAVAEQAGMVATCAEDTLSRIDQIERLGTQALAASSSDELSPLLTEIDRLTHIVLEAPAARKADACSLEDAKGDLQTLAVQI